MKWTTASEILQIREPKQTLGVKNSRDKKFSLRALCSATIKQKKPPTFVKGFFFFSGRGGQIRTDDLLLPKQARYRATLHPDGLVDLRPAHLSKNFEIANIHFLFIPTKKRS